MPLRFFTELFLIYFRNIKNAGYSVVCCYRRALARGGAGGQGVEPAELKRANVGQKVQGSFYRG